MTSQAPAVLVVDDDADIREALTEVLSEAGYEVLTAPEGRAALETLRSAARKPFLILLDLRMPGMGGFEFRAEQLRDPALADVPVVTFSVYGIDRAAEEAVHADGTVRKPLDLDDLLNVVERFKVGSPRTHADP